MSITFSVITITKDNPEEFSYTAESLINQKYKNFEWIVIDKSSEKESFETIDKYNLKEGFDMWTEDEADGRQRVAPSAIMSVMVKAVQELSAQVEELKAKLEDK